MYKTLKQEFNEQGKLVREKEYQTYGNDKKYSERRWNAEGKLTMERLVTPDEYFYTHNEEVELEKLFNIAHSLREQTLGSCANWDGTKNYERYNLTKNEGCCDKLGLLISELEELAKYRKQEKK